MRTFSIQTLGCKVNQYESEQIATLLRHRGLCQVGETDHADLRVINTCSVTIQAASKSRQTVRRSIHLPVLQETIVKTHGDSKVLVTGCWATSNPEQASAIAGVSGVIGHHQSVADELDRLLHLWNKSDEEHIEQSQTQSRDEGWMKPAAGVSAEQLINDNKPHVDLLVKRNPMPGAAGTWSLPQLDSRQQSHQCAYMKIQDGCDAHCTYCIIPTLRPTLWSKPIEAAVREAQQLVDAGHREIVLTGIFLGAYGQATALRRRQDRAKPIADLVEALCNRVVGLSRLRLSSLEPGDLGGELLRALQGSRQVVPHFHLPLQSGSDRILHRMNRQYSRDDYLRMLEQVHESFDRPAITTDIIVGFPGETDTEFAETLDIVDRAKFPHIHAFSFSPRPGTAAARWGKDYVHGPVVNERIGILTSRARQFDLEYRRQFLGETVEILVERPKPGETLAHGRCERWFDVWMDDPRGKPGDLRRLRIERVTPSRTFGIAE